MVLLCVANAAVKIIAWSHGHVVQPSQRRAGATAWPLFSAFGVAQAWRLANVAVRLGLRPILIIASNRYKKRALPL